MTPYKGAGKGKLRENTQKVLTGHGKGVNETVKNDLRFLTQATAKETQGRDRSANCSPPRAKSSLFLYSWEFRIAFTFFKVYGKKTKQIKKKKIQQEPYVALKISNIYYIFPKSGDPWPTGDAGLGQRRSQGLPRLSLRC